MDFDWSTILTTSGSLVRSEDLRRFEDDIGFDLPDDYRNFLLRFNGGRVIVEHHLWAPELDSHLLVNYLSPLTSPSPFVGLVEARDIQLRYRMCMRQGIESGDNMGTGFYYLILAGEKRGAVFFIYKEDRPKLSQAEWENWEVRIPDDMVEVSPDFDSFGELILANSDLRRNEE